MDKEFLKKFIEWYSETKNEIEHCIDKNHRKNLFYRAWLNGYKNATLDCIKSTKGGYNHD